jgi:hypothetical protein
MSLHTDSHFIAKLKFFFFLTAQTTYGTGTTVKILLLASFVSKLNINTFIF